jgi:hypothetical protein
VRWVGYVTCTVKLRNAYNILVGNPERRDSLKDIGLDGRII